MIVEKRYKLIPAIYNFVDALEKKLQLICQPKFSDDAISLDVIDE